MNPTATLHKPPQHYTTRDWTRLRIPRLRSIEYPQWAEESNGNPLKNVQTLTAFAVLCTQSLDVIKKHQPVLCILEAQIVRQYFVVVLQRYKDWQELHSTEVTCTSALAKEMWILRKVLERYLPDASLDADPECIRAEGWISTSIAVPVLAALASRCELGDTFTDTAKRPGEVEQWLKKGKEFLPSVVAFDISHRLIGETAPHWRKWTFLNDWEKRVRDRRFIASQETWGRAASILQVVTSTNPDADDSRLVDEGRIAIKQNETLHNFFSHHSSGSTWWAVTTQRLKHKDQCPTCRVLFNEVTLLIGNRREPGKLGERRDELRPWQCAEADLIRQKSVLASIYFQLPLAVSPAQRSIQAKL